MIKKYYRQQGTGCFRCALLNFFMEIGDRRTAERVNSSYVTHPLFSSVGGVEGMGLTRLVYDFSGGLYQGRMWADSLSSQENDSSKKMVEEEIKAGRIRRHKAKHILLVALLYSVFKKPAIITYETHRLGEKRITHSIVLTGLNECIDDGEKRPINLRRLNLTSLLLVHKSLLPILKYE